MRRMKVKSFAGVSVVALAMSLGAIQAPPTAPLAGQPQPPAAGAGRGARPPQALVPIAATTLAANPHPFLGMTLTLAAAGGQPYRGPGVTGDPDPAKSGG